MKCVCVDSVQHPMRSAHDSIFVNHWHVIKTAVSILSSYASCCCCCCCISHFIRSKHIKMCKCFLQTAFSNVPGFSIRRGVGLQIIMKKLFIILFVNMRCAAFIWTYLDIIWFSFCVSRNSVVSWIHSTLTINAFLLCLYTL